MANDGTVKIGTELDDSGFRSGISKLGSVAKSAFVGVSAGIASASATIGIFSKQSLDAYANYEQLIGGVNKLFEDSADELKKYAKNAYKTSGLSANQYMEQATKFSASLISSLEGDTKEAVELTNVALTAMSDNVNVFGTNMEDVQNAYQGFAKQNYTMLDNLRLGYGGTKEEMERLVQEASKMIDIQKELGLSVDANSLSFDNIIRAIQVVQANMNILGTTTKEASTTIQGSLSMTKAAYENLMTGIADENANLDQLIDNFVNSASKAADNILPRLVQIFSGLGSTFDELSPILATSISDLVDSMLPSLLDAGAKLLTGLIDGILESLPELANSATQIIMQFSQELILMLPELADVALQIILQLSNFLIESLPELIPAIVEIVLQIVETLIDNLDLIVDAAFELILALTEGIIDSLPVLIEKAPEIIIKLVEALIRNAPKIKDASIELIRLLYIGLFDAVKAGINKIEELVNEYITKPLKEKVGDMNDVGKFLVEGLWNGILEKGSWLKNKIFDYINTIKGWFTGSSGFDTHSPSKWSEGVGENVDAGLALGLTQNKNKIQAASNEVIDIIKSLPNAMEMISSANADIKPNNIPQVDNSTYFGDYFGNNSEIVSMMQTIINLIQDGKIMTVDKRVLAKVVNDANRANTRMTGVSSY